MSFGPRKPAIGPSRTTRPTIVRKTITKAPVTKNDNKTPTAIVKPKAVPPAVVPPVKKTSSVTPKPSAAKPPTPEPTYDYESDFESDESVPSDDSTSTEEPEENTDSESTTSEVGDDEHDEIGDGFNTQEIEKKENNGHSTLNREVVLECLSTHVETLKIADQLKQSKNNPRNTRSVDILSKISLNDVTVDLYKFDPEEYAELRTHFGVTSTVAHGKQIQTDSGLISTAQQTSKISTRDGYTSMHGGFHNLHTNNTEEESFVHQENDDDDVQSYSSLQNIERMFTSLNEALERRFSKHAHLLQGITAGGQKKNVNQQRSILRLVRRSAPILEALLESKRFKSRKSEAGLNSKAEDKEDKAKIDESNTSTNVMRSFDMGKMCSDYEVKLIRAKNVEHDVASFDRFVIELWARGIHSRPMYRFSSWALVKCLDYECRKQMMVFGGTDDGTLLMWLGDAGRCQNEILAPHQILAPSMGPKHKMSCWEIVSVKVLPVSVTRESAMDISTETVLNQVFGLFSSGIIVVWHVQMDAIDYTVTNNSLNARLAQSNISLVQSKVIDLNLRIGNRLGYNGLRTFANLILHDHNQVVLSSDRSVIRLSHFVESEYDPALLIQPDPAHSIVNLKRMPQTTDMLFALYSNKTVRVLKLNTASDGTDCAQYRHRKHDNLPNLMLSVCTNKSCTIQSIVHDEAKRYANTNSVGGSRADGGTIATRTTEPVKHDSYMLTRPRFHHGQQILFFGHCHPNNLLSEQNFNEKSVQRST